MANLLPLVQLLSVEFHPTCTLSAVHSWCPSSLPDRYDGLPQDRLLDDDTIVDVAVRAWNDYGFRGLLCWHNYNEPLMQTERMFRLMDRVRERAPDARFLLWTNGTLFPADVSGFSRFAVVQITDYGGDDSPDPDRLEALRRTCQRVNVTPSRTDGRLAWPTSSVKAVRCVNPFKELLVDAYGNLKLCCYDWRGQASPGNLLRDGLDACVERWSAMAETVLAWPIRADAPALCQTCAYRHDRLPRFSLSVRRAAKAWIAQQEVARG